jgi:SAM-dependent methyltransferase
MAKQDSSTLKQIVKEKYSEIVEQSDQQGGSSCCGSDCGCSSDFDVMTPEYTNVIGYVKEADLGLGCGIPTEVADIKPGHTVLDLGSGAGNDCFVARSIVGDKGRVIGLDMTEKMIAKANANNAKLAFSNVEFRLGDIESMPVDNETADVLISNCVLNLVPDKAKAFAEIYRVLKPGGHFTISDIVLQGVLPKKLQDDAVMYAGCVSGALQKEDYLGIIKNAGFANVTVAKERATPLPNEVYAKYLSPDEVKEFKKSGAGIFSITVVATKPAAR